MLIRKPADIPYSEVTPRSLYLRRREFIQSAAAGTIGAAMALAPAVTRAQGHPKLPNVRKSSLSTTEPPND